MERELELYLHIPFCVRKCAYCDFLSFPQSRAVQEAYVRKLKDEIREVGSLYHEDVVSTVFVGGGTPSILESKWIVEIFDVLRKSFRLDGDAEISMEANPGTVDREKLTDYRRAGINRLSFGLQSASDRELSLLGRIHTFSDFLDSYRLARESGFSNINVDLMSALPGQTVDSWRETLLRTADLGPEHISAYSLIIEEGTPFYETYGGEEGKRLLPEEDSERAMYRLTKELLEKEGYQRYEISNYARPGRRCRHNVGYWTGVPYLGLGLGASSYADGKRFANPADLGQYLERGWDRNAKEQAVRLSEREMQEEFFFLGLRLVEGVSLEEFRERFGTEASAVYPGVMERLALLGAAEFADGRFRLTEYGLDVSNYVMAEFLQD